MTTHLTEEQIHDWLIDGSLDSGCLAHLSTCDACQREVDLLTGATADFNELGNRWAQREAPRVVPLPLRPAQRLGSSRARWSVGALCGACLACLVLGLETVHIESRTRSATAAQAPSAGEVASDNRWLGSMDRDLRAGPDSIAISASDLQPLPVHRHGGHPRAGVTPE